MSRRKGKWLGRCFEAAYHKANELEGAGARDVRIVHGTPMGRGPLGGQRIGHAWVESNGFAHDLTIDLVLPRPAYYALGRMTEAHVTRYTLTEWRLEALRTGHFGPWRGPAMTALMNPADEE